MYLEIPYEIGENDDVKECFDKLELDIEDERKGKVIKITSFYYNKIKECTNVKFHPFILYFTTPEPLFNLFTFGRFFEAYKTDEDIKSIIKDISFKLARYDAQRESENISERCNQIHNASEEKCNKICSNMKNSLNQDNKIDIFVSENTKFIKGYSSEANFKSYKKIAENISEPIFRKILKVKDGFEKIYEFSGKKIPSTVRTKDSNKRDQLINALFVFLKNISKTEYHEYISAVLCLKAFCFKEIVTCKQTMPRSIVEILFLADVLKIEFENENKNASAINTYSAKFIGFIRNYLDEQRIEYAKNLVLNTFNHFLLPRTSSILKTFIFVNLFA
ncbi:hypothetical protein CWI36_2941p0010, partial [Hamiltosporidium magnivora]